MVSATDWLHWGRLVCATVIKATWGALTPGWSWVGNASSLQISLAADFRVPEPVDVVAKFGVIIWTLPQSAHPKALIKKRPTQSFWILVPVHRSFTPARRRAPSPQPSVSSLTSVWALVKPCCRLTVCINPSRQPVSVSLFGELLPWGGFLADRCPNRFRCDRLSLNVWAVSSRCELVSVDICLRNTF